MNSLSDQQLLRDYAGKRSEEAFAELVRRHVDLVHSAALRMVRNAHLAEDVTQGAFLALAQNAPQLSDHPVLSGWLHRTAQNLAVKAVRTDVRRRAREQEAAAMNELLAHESDAMWEHVAPHLDAALKALSEADRDALMLRYFERKSAQEMARVLGVSTEAAQKRVTRAVERLREFFAQRGIAIGASGLTAVISANAVQAAPVGLAITISTAATLAGTTIAATTTATATALKLATMSKLKIGLAVGVLLIISGTIGTLSLLRHRSDRSSLKTMTLLSDGSRFFLQQVSFGTSFHVSRPWNEADGTPTGRSFELDLGPFATKTLFCQTLRQGRVNFFEPNVARLRVVDDQGDSFDAVLGPEGASSATESFGAWRLNAFPRRGRDLRLRFLSFDGLLREWRCEAEYSIPNPSRGPYSEWRPDALPRTTNEGNLAVTLIAFTAFTAPANSDNPSANADGMGKTELEFRVEENGEATPDWIPQALWLADATGNAWEPAPSPAPPKSAAANVAASFPGGLWASEPAWRLRVEWVRTNRFASGELLTIPGIRVPVGRETVQVKGLHHVNGVEVTNLCIASRDSPLPAPFGTGAFEDDFTLAFTTDDIPQGKRLNLQRVTDSQGRDIPAAEVVSRNRPGRFFMVKPHPDSLELTLHVSGARSRFTEFTAKPDQRIDRQQY